MAHGKIINFVVHSELSHLNAYKYGYLFVSVVNVFILKGRITVR